jgi:hypothetical protein
MSRVDVVVGADRCTSIETVVLLAERKSQTCRLESWRCCRIAAALSNSLLHFLQATGNLCSSLAVAARPSPTQSDRQWATWFAHGFQVLPSPRCSIPHLISKRCQGPKSFLFYVGGTSRTRYLEDNSVSLSPSWPIRLIPAKHLSP